jgi:hypothetical protein
MDGRRVYHDRDEFRKLLESVFKGFIRIPAVLLGRDDGNTVREGDMRLSGSPPKSVS